LRKISSISRQALLMGCRAPNAGLRPGMEKSTLLAVTSARRFCLFWGNKESSQNQEGMIKG